MCSSFAYHVSSKFITEKNLDTFLLWARQLFCHFMFYRQMQGKKGSHRLVMESRIFYDRKLPRVNWKWALDIFFFTLRSLVSGSIFDWFFILLLYPVRIRIVIVISNYVQLHLLIGGVWNVFPNKRRNVTKCSPNKSIHWKWQIAMR